eukprot:TRINITY_DN415_c0_g1_i2.p1 TRINITY_DN415_c0_g1~~TRINITY_DN415_c0_g1_i2.p1  ORF type:complete len:317 (-),score=62.43 TRINITY_DN415_c0_g1_i2:519-1469(-)
MAAPNLQHLAPCITCHAWNADKSQVALCPNSNELQIYARKADGSFDLLHVLTAHDQVITSVDWAGAQNRIVSCSQDRNAYVWTPVGDGWKPTLVILRINRAATHVKWSPSGNKFAVASGSKLVSICYFEAEQDWWVSKHIKKHTSTVLAVDWHPSDLLLATGSSDFKCRIVYAGVKGVDKRAETAFGEKLSFGAVLAEFTAGTSWVHSVAWSPSGDRLVYVGHNSSINFVNDVKGGDAAVQKIQLADLPYRVVAFVSENSVIAAGHDCNPNLFTFSGGSWTQKGKIDTKQKNRRCCSLCHPICLPSFPVHSFSWYC